MIILIGIVTFIMLLNCVVLVLLVLMQLPKKEAGAGLAFGAGATDALFGAGSGNFLTKATKYSAVIFFATVIALSLLQRAHANAPGSKFLRELEQKQSQAPAPTAPPANMPAVAPNASTPGATNALSIPVPTQTTPPSTNPGPAN